MAKRGQKIFTVYDMMDARGVFDENPANASSADYAGPVQFPMMVYHPEGATRQIVPGEIVATPLGAKIINEQHELIYRVVKDQAELDAAKAEGWHLHPKDAEAARRERVPETPEEEIARLKRELAEAKGTAKPVPSAQPLVGRKTA